MVRVQCYLSVWGGECCPIGVRNEVFSGVKGKTFTIEGYHYKVSVWSLTSINLNDDRTWH